MNEQSDGGNSVSAEWSENVSEAKTFENVTDWPRWLLNLMVI
jgi:hypothetical protein